MPPALLRTKQVLPKITPLPTESRAAYSDNEQRIRNLVFDRYAPPCVVVDQRFNLQHSHGDVSPFVKLPHGDISVNILDMVSGALRVEMRLLLQKAEREQRSLRSNPIAFEVNGGKVALTLVAIPDGPTRVNGKQTLVLFETQAVVEQPKDGELEENTSLRIRELEQELSATRDHLQTNIEELEASNEELQSVNEEYQSATEELQSANEELQTTNEELQSTNEELNTVNEELRVRSEELIGANRDLESILNTAVSGIVVLDKDLRVSRYSTASRSIFDLLPTSIGKPLIAVGGAIDLALLSNEIQRALASGTAVERELELGDKAFLVRLVPQPDGDDEGGLVISFVEVTGPLAAMREARRLATVLTDSSDAITVLSPRGDILSWNRGAEAMYGYSETEALAMNVIELVPPAARSEWDDLLGRVYRRGSGETVEAVRLHRDGHEVEVSVAVSILLDEKGDPYALATTERDISPIREAEAQRRQAELAHEARLSTAGEMAAGMAHELNQPITSLVHFCDVALAIARDFDPQRRAELTEVLTDATAQAQRAGEIIRTLRQFLGRREAVRSARQINDVVNDTVRLLKLALLQNNVELKLSLDESLPPVEVDVTQISQVLVNLLRNGIEAMVDGNCERREITITTRRDHNLVGSVQVSVHDTGPGVDNETALRLFEPFRTTKPNGLGMGLWMSRSIVESHGGRLWADEGRTDGAAFHFSLPAAEDENEPR